ncbi:MAG TPA: C45 family autoproteolytic acyltransferase/hydrolase [bacterium]|nr:C45 family autoproteolytic acyltransferase/hydrolase [bacterium]
MNSNRKKIIKRSILFTIPLALVLFTICFLVLISDKLPEEIRELKVPVGDSAQIDGNLYGLKNNRFRLSDSGLYELYIEGTPLEIGTYEGRLTKDLIIRQEVIFVNMLNHFIPGSFSRFFIKIFVLVFNKSMQNFVSNEYLSEIYGISTQMEFNYGGLGNSYFRVLNYHAAHDIGHMVSNLNLVGCTAFSVRNSKSANGDLITGRNFDFFIGDRFAHDKIIAFVKPQKGIPFAMVTWGGMIGTVSGMNSAGLSITLNAAQSDVPLKTATPVSLVAREILQYSDTIEKAYEIAKSRNIFVSQMFFISSAVDNRSAVIEKTPERTEIYYSDSDSMAITNHFTGSLKGTEKDQSSEGIRVSKGRLQRVEELIGRSQSLNEAGVVDILRNTKGFGDKYVEPGSEFAINQYLAHHSVVFNNTKKIMFVSTSPWQFGEFRAYELEKVFREFPGLNADREISSSELNIPSDPFMKTDEFKKIKQSRDDGTFKNDDIRFRKDGLNM